MDNFSLVVCVVGSCILCMHPFVLNLLIFIFYLLYWLWCIIWYVIVYCLTFGRKKLLVPNLKSIARTIFASSTINKRADVQAFNVETQELLLAQIAGRAFGFTFATIGEITAEQQQVIKNFCANINPNFTFRCEEFIALGRVEGINFTPAEVALLRCKQPSFELQVTAIFHTAVQLAMLAQHCSVHRLELLIRIKHLANWLQLSDAVAEQVMLQILGENDEDLNQLLGRPPVHNTSHESHTSSQEQQATEDTFQYSEFFHSEQFFAHDEFVNTDSEQHDQQNTADESIQHPQLSAKLKEAYATLEVDTNISKHELKRQFIELMKKYHPDRLTNKNLSAEERTYYMHKVQRINEAYTLITKSLEDEK